MAKKPTYEELEQKVKKLEEEAEKRKRAEEALLVAKELLERVFATTHLMITYMDTSFNFIRVNPAYAEADERTPEFFVGKNHFDLYPNNENEAIFRSVITKGSDILGLGPSACKRCFR